MYLKIVKQDDMYETIHKFITDEAKTVVCYEDMINIVLDMVREGFCFSVDRELLRDALESLAYMYEPNDDMNKERVILQLIDLDDDDDDSDDGDASMDMLNNLGRMMGMTGPQTEGDDVKDVKDDEPTVKDEVEDEVKV